ncbi:MAG: zf-HC2 domain-containing protein [Rubrivivax sp.]
MKTTLSCREVTRLVLEGEDRHLRLSERLGVRVHMLVCKACPTVARQMQLMRGAMGRWKDDGNGDEPQR